MPLTTPPSVQLGADPMWHDTEWDDTPPPNLVQGVRLSQAGAEYVHWTAKLDADAPRGFRLLVGGLDSAALVKITGDARVRVRVLSTPETIIRDGGTIRYDG